MKYNCIEYAIEKRIARITLNRLDKRNALNSELIDELKKALTDAAYNEQVRVVIISANGKVFSAGADLQYLLQLQKNSYEENLIDSNHFAGLLKQIYTHPKIIVAQIEGHAIAGGCGLATVCDFSFAVPEAQFGYNEVKIGFVPAIVMIFLIRKIGEGKAKELLLTGKLIDASSAKEFGLINFLSRADKIKSEVEQFVLSICEESSSQSIKTTKTMMAKISELSLDEGLRYAAETNASIRATEDFKKGVSAFLNKEKLKW